MSQRLSRDPSALTDAARQMLLQLGQLLREQRQAQGQELYDVAARLRIKPSYLFALEEGDIGLAPGRPYALGFLRSYADHLGLDGQAVIDHVKGAIDTTASATPLHYRVPIAESRRSGGFAIGLSILLAAGVYGAWHVYFRDEPVLERVAAVPGDLGRFASGILEVDRPGGPATPPAQATPPAPPPVAADGFPGSVPPQGREPELAALPGPAPVVAPRTTRVEPTPPTGGPQGEALPAAAPSPPPIVAARPSIGTDQAAAAELPAPTAGRVVLVAREPSWVQVRSPDRGFSRSKTLEVGERLELPARDDLALTTGNAGGVEVLLDEQSLGVLGQSGKVLRSVALTPEALRTREWAPR